MTVRPPSDPAEAPLLLLLAAYCAAAAAAPVLVRAIGRDAFAPLAAVLAAAAGWAALPWLDGGAPRTESWSWIPGLGLHPYLRSDPLTWMMTVIVGGVGALVVLYCGRYFTGAEPKLAAFAGELVAFAAAMLGLILADDLVLLYVFWELTTVLSYLLIGYDAERGMARRAATQAIVITTFGGLAMLVGLVLLGQAAGTHRLSAIVAAPPHGGAVTAAVALILVGALSKSALVPFGLWLPGAMAAPTPVSAFLHAAAMVKAGVFLVARLAPAFAGTPGWRPVVLGCGVATMLLAGWRALREHDLKLLLAYGTVSQLGFMFVLLGAGNRVAALAGFTVLLAHALFKSALFLAVGVVDHSTGTRDLRKLSGLGRRTPVLYGASVAAAASMAGVPATLGFAGKEAAYEAFLGGDAALVALVTVGSALTAGYSLRFLWGAFARKEGVEPREVHRPGVPLLAPVVLLAAAGVVVGLLAAKLDAPIGREAAPFPVRGHGGYHLSAWHGFGLPLLLTAVSLALGAGLFAAGRLVARVPRLFEPENVYLRFMHGLNTFALQLTGFVQRGSLPDYLLIILLAAVGLAGGSVLAALPWPVPLGGRVWDGPAQGLVALLTVVAAAAAIRARDRGKTVVLSGASGFGVSTLFVLQGAPDLALTQFLVETASLIVFVLVLRRLPARFSTRSPAQRGVHLAAGALAGLTATVVTLLAARSRVAAPISGAYPAAAKEAGGSNIVATVLVDLRAWDTLGETVVIALAALGVTSMVFARRPVSVPPAPDEDTEVWGVREVTALDADTEPDRWIAAGSTLAAERRSIVFEVVARTIFHTVLLYSLFLLFTAHSAPGGGFSGGIVAGLALAVRYLAGGPYELWEAAPVSAGALLGAGVVATAGTALGGLVWGGAVLQSASLDPHLPLLGHVHFFTSLLFEIGVYLIVVGLVLTVLNVLGAEIDRQTGADRAGGGVPG
ncbi:Na+/H+ antiporter subunit A [Actinomadura opuntiae]|uniref:Na+/H+ antiporter subunit A n=1 Tax=Actinomadura sp. OS1-43 TaxID=604315 RepID=UPI00255A964B|nr:Na+/H+ antiporter subunit A [Actinomadura sp. OS1-43]MDL4815188.1 Na+/H+ antiporter subunit A [Actinomadura sp. OS1-43]